MAKSVGQKNPTSVVVELTVTLKETDGNQEVENFRRRTDEVEAKDTTLVFMSFCQVNFGSKMPFQCYSTVLHALQMFSIQLKNLPVNHQLYIVYNSKAVIFIFHVSFFVLFSKLRPQSRYPKNCIILRGTICNVISLKRKIHYINISFADFTCTITTFPI